MAIFSRTQIPKYQNPIRITRPYIKPNYLADTINSAIQGYGSIQGMNMQQQLFNAKLKAAADAKLAKQKQIEAQQHQNNIIQEFIKNRVTPQTSNLNLQGGDPYGIAGIDPYTSGALTQDYAYPGEPMSTQESLAQAMQQNPNDPMQILRIASILGKAPFQQQGHTYDPAAIAQAQNRFNKNEIGYDRTVSKLLNKWGNQMVNVEGADKFLAPSGIEKFLQTNPIKTENQLLGGKSLWDAKLSDVQFLPNWDTGGKPNPGYQTSTLNPAWNEYSATGGTEGFQNWAKQELRPLLTKMIRRGATDSEVSDVLSEVAKLIMPKEEGKHYRYRGATSSEIAELIQKHGN